MDRVVALSSGCCERLANNPTQWFLRWTINAYLDTASGLCQNLYWYRIWAFGCGWQNDRLAPLLTTRIRNSHENLGSDGCYACTCKLKTGLVHFAFLQKPLSGLSPFFGLVGR